MPMLSYEPMPEMQKYEHFRYDEPGLTLDEAIYKASELRKQDAGNFYRVEPSNEAGTSFFVTKVPFASVYADFMARVSKMMSRGLVLNSKRS